MYGERTLLERLKVFSLFAFIPLFAFTVVVLIPFLLGVVMTFTDWDGISTSITFKGLENYRIAFNDSHFMDSLLLTFKYVFYTLVLTNVIAFGLALLVTSGIRGQNFFRMGFFTPNLIGGIILGFIWQFIFSRVIVYLGEALNWQIFSSSWLADPDKAFWTLVIVGVWQSSGYMMLIYIAGLMGIPKSLLEAAKIDGASKWQQLVRIKIPLMITAFTISVFLTLQRSFVVYEVNLSLTNGGPFRSTELLAMHVYNEAFLYQNFGPGQAKAFILFLVVAAIALIQVRAMKKLEVEA
ncbi:ABC-type transporter, integral membrane subunit [Caldalkalibacillus thermarum TA2.A1]|uniref:ABC-type transporter, integral membrane subunit n=1 Tax=Caldalkalibacillus thermarum (strain TA2.A1) TaxID=986075 RepID=F5L4U7_CALTT|nr:sugar ABC transporter permease [Caldalkalibacillus thermarum]EGL83635.1 ABC-type transporter, integral membrane subunit [Caldalkalibacillus thermarum TA2.A1]QZT34077.1 sugar ABC transporter permease [Caldalkalibacillus thermarum TA2.A1]